MDDKVKNPADGQRAYPCSDPLHSYMRISPAILRSCRYLLLQCLGFAAAIAGPLEDGQALLKAGKVQEAEAAFTQAVTATPTDVDAWLGRFQARKAGGNMAGAEADLDHAVQLAPHNGTVLVDRGLFREQVQNDYKGAVEDFSSYLTLYPKAWAVYMDRGRAQMKAGALPAALADLDRALEIKPDYVTAFIGRGSVLSKMGQDTEAAESYHRALALEPNNAAAQKALAALQAKKSGRAGAKTAASPGADATKVAAQPTKAGVPGKEAATKSPSTPAAPKANDSPPATTTPPSPAAAAGPHRQRYYKLTRVEMSAENKDYSNLNGKGSYESRGTKAAYRYVVQEEKGQTTTSLLRWEVPDVIVPGQPAKIRIEASNDRYLTYGLIDWQNAPVPGDSWVKCPLVGVHLTRNPYMPMPDQTTDEFDLVIPDISQTPEECREGKGDRELILRVRKREEMESFGLLSEGGGSSKLTPKQIPLVEIRHPQKAWLNGPQNDYSFRSMVFVVYYQGNNWPVARYVYECSDAVSDDYEFKLDPPDRKDLRADGQDGVLLKARAKPLPGTPGPAPAAATASAVFSADGPGAAWADLSKTEMSDGWKVVYVQASNPDVVHGTTKPPESITIRVDGQAGNRMLSGAYGLKVAANPAIDAKPDRIEFLGKSGAKGQVKVAIENAGDKPWKFRAEFARKNRPVARVDLSPAEGAGTTLTLTETGLDPEDASPTDTAVLRIIAEQEDRPPLERDIRVYIAQEGLFASTVGRDPDGNLFRVAADGSGKSTDVDFRVYLYDPVKKQLVSNKDAVSQLKFECLEPAVSAGARAVLVGQLQNSFAGLRAQNDPPGTYRFKLLKELPSDGRIIRCDFKATLPGHTEPNFTAIFTLGLVTTSDGPGSPEWQLELDRCEEIIHKFVPPVYYPRMQAMLDKHKMTLGAEGLHLLREKIWLSAANLTLGEGGKGYADEAAWADRITTTLEWSQWAGDMAFGAVIGTWTGPYGAFGATQLKSLIISAVNAYQDGQGPEDWLWENLSTIPGLIEGKVIDVGTFEKLGVQNKAKAWAIYVSYHFLKNLYHGQSVIEALKNTAREAGNNVLASWISEETKGNANRSVTGWAGAKAKQAASTVSATASSVRQSLAGETPPAAAPAGTPASPGTKVATEEVTTPKNSAVEEPVPAAQSGSSTESEAVAQVRSRATVAGNGKTYANPDDVLEIMRDPSKVRSLKSAPPEVQEAFSNTREIIYRQHDYEVVEHVKETMPDMQNRIVRVLEFRTPGENGPSLNTDRDYRVCYFSEGGQWIEVPRKNWENKSYETFARLTGGPTDSPERSREWAAQHQQLATDKSHSEASAAFTDQKTVWNEETRQLEKVQVTSNFEQVAKLQLDGVDIADPASLGQMYVVKVGDAKQPHEALVQANKAVNALTALRTAYNVQGRDIGELPEKIRAGMEAVARVNDQLKADPNRRDPVAIAEANRTLQDNGFRDLGDFMDKMSGQFESLKNMRAKPKSP